MKHSVDHDTFTITFERAFEAPREDVFDAWTDPEQIAQWWDPTGVPLAACEIDLKPGGAFKFVNRDNAHGPPFAGIYRVIERPSLLQFDAMGALGTVKLAEAKGTTTMVVSIRCSSKEHLDMFVKLGVADGTDKTLDNLVDYIVTTK